MSRKEKLIIKFLNNPQSLKYKHIARILSYLGFEKISIRGSHCKWNHAGLKIYFIIPLHGNECKNIYKKNIAKIIQKYFYD